MEPELALSTPWGWVAAAIIFVAGVTQGVLGFGFPAIATPLLALITDIKGAIILNLLPNFTVNLIGAVRGGHWSASLGKYWPVAVYMLIGSFLGTQFLIVAPQEPVRLLLALSIFAYLYQQRLTHLDWGWLARYPRYSAMLFGVAGGFFSGSVNQSLPPLLIYFSLLNVPALAMTQILNFCFLGGKTVQAATLAGAGQIHLSAALANIPLTLVAITGLYVGTHLQKRFSAATYKRLLRYALFAIALLLLWQASKGWRH